MTPTQRQAMEMALEALKGYEHMYGEYRNAEAAIAALRAALAEQPAARERLGETK